MSMTLLVILTALDMSQVPPTSFHIPPANVQLVAMPSMLSLAAFDAALLILSISAAETPEAASRSAVAAFEVAVNAATVFLSTPAKLRPLVILPDKAPIAASLTCI